MSETKAIDLRWYHASKWGKNSEGKYIEACTYLITRDEILCFSKEVDMGDLYTYDYYMVEDLNISVPYKAGDILECDGFPFGPQFHILIVDIGDNHDCCCV